MFEENFNVRITLWSPGLGMVLCMHILTEWFLPSFAHYFKKLSAALDSKSTNFDSWRKCNFQCGSVSMYILTLWFLPSFAHYFKKLSAALDSIRINLNSVEENLTFNVLTLCPFLSQHGLAWFREHVHPNFMILTIFRPLFYETFSSFGQHKNQF